MTSQSDLTALLGSRICHDLISPIGAIANGVELLQMSGMEDSPELALIADSVDAANARVRLFRIAFGAPSGQPVSAREINEILTPMASSKRLSLKSLPENPLPRDQTRLAFLLFLCAETLLPWGGDLRIDADEDNLTIDIAGERMKEVPELLDRLENGAEELPQAGDLHFEIARRAAADLGRRIEVVPGESAVRILAR